MPYRSRSDPRHLHLIVQQFARPPEDIAYIGVAYIVAAYIVMVYTVMASIVMAQRFDNQKVISEVYRNQVA